MGTGDDDDDDEDDDADGATTTTTTTIGTSTCDILHAHEILHDIFYHAHDVFG